MRQYTFVIVPGDQRSSKKFSLSVRLVRTLGLCGLFLTLMLGYWIADYIQLRNLRASYVQVLQENRNIRGEARILMSNLEEVKSSLRKVRTYTSKLSEITNLQTASLSKRTGIGAIQQKPVDPTGQKRDYVGEQVMRSTLPSSVDFENLVFRPVFQRLNSIGMAANTSAFDLQHMIAALSQQKTLLASVPSVTPVDGWVTSGFGVRMSPFTGESANHKGIDVAAPIGTPVRAPADGVVVFSGVKEGFGNFVMLAHGYGIVTGYGHSAQNLVTTGQVIKRGEQLSTVGQTGRTTGPHLHYEIWVNGRVVDPKRFILNSDELPTLSH